MVNMKKQSVTIEKIIEEARKLGFEVHKTETENEGGFFVRNEDKEKELSVHDILKLFYYKDDEIQEILADDLDSLWDNNEKQIHLNTKINVEVNPIYLTYAESEVDKLAS